MTTTEYQSVVFERDGKPALAFSGRLLAEVTSHEQDGERAMRWSDMALYEVAADRGWVVAEIGRSEYEGEDDRRRATHCTTLAEVLRALQREGRGGLYLTNLAKDLLEAAVEVDDEFAQLLVERI